jgi:hypothetical protein
MLSNLKFGFVFVVNIAIHASKICFVTTHDYFVTGNTEILPITVMKLCKGMSDFREKFTKVFNKSPQASFDDINWSADVKLAPEGK